MVDSVRSSAGTAAEQGLFQFETLVVYQKSLTFVDKVYEITRSFPQDELFGLTSQFRRAATSVPLNIAEGSAGTKVEFRQFIKVARRSIRECVAIIEIAFRQKYIQSNTKQELRERCSEISRMLNGLLKSVSNQDRTPNSQLRTPNSSPSPNSELRTPNSELERSDATPNSELERSDATPNSELERSDATPNSELERSDATPNSKGQRNG